MWGNYFETDVALASEREYAMEWKAWVRFRRFDNELKEVDLGFLKWTAWFAIEDSRFDMKIKIRDWNRRIMFMFEIKGLNWKINS